MNGETPWPLDAEYTRVNECTGHFEDIACIYLPMRVLAEGAQHFNDQRGISETENDTNTPWRLLLNTFLRGAQSAFIATAFSSRRAFHIEQVVGPEPEEGFKEPETYGYRFWLHYSKGASFNSVAADRGFVDGEAEEASDSESDSDDGGAGPEGSGGMAAEPELNGKEGPKSLDEIMEQILTYYRRYRAACESPKALVAKAARKEIEMIDRGGLGYACWKSIKSAREWREICEACLGTEMVGGDVVQNATQTVFNPAMAFGEQRACPEQRAEQLMRMGEVSGNAPVYVISAGDTWNIRWTKPERVYRVPEEIVTAGPAAILKRLMPHQEVVLRRASNHLNILLPLLVESRPVAPQDADGDAEMGREAEREAEEAVRFDNDQRAAAATALQGALLNRLSRAAPDGLRRVRNPIALHKSVSRKRKAIDSPFADGGAQQVAERMKNATAYDPIARPVSRAIDLIAAECAPTNRVAARKMAIVAREVALNCFESIGVHTQNTSPQMKVLMTEADSQELRKVPPKVREWYRFNHASLELLTPLGGYKRKFLRNMEHIFHVNHLHRQCENVEWFSLDAYRNSYDLHLHYAAISKKGGTGKSNLWYILEKLRVKGTVTKLTYTTAAAFTGTESDDPNCGDMINIWDEVAPSMFAPGDKNSTDHEARIKMVLSNNHMLVNSLMIDDNGRRRSISTWVHVMMCMMCSTNIDENQIQHAMRRRFFCAAIPEEPTGRSLTDTMAQANLDHPAMRPILKLFQEVHWRKQVNMADAEKLIHSLALPDVSMDICGLLNMALAQKLRTFGFFTEPNPSVFTRVDQMARKKAMWRAIMYAFYMPDAPKGADPESRRAVPLPKEVTARAMAERLSRRWFVDVESYVAAAGALAEEIVNPLEHGVRQALTKLYLHKRNAGPQVFEDMFRAERHMTISAGATGGRHDSYTRDYNYVVFDYNMLVVDLMAIIPTVMNGFRTNTGAIKRVLRGLTDRAIQSYPYIVKDTFLPDGSSNAVLQQDQTQPLQAFVAAREHNHKIEIHTDFLEASVQQQATRPPTDALTVVAEALKEILSSKGMIPRRMTLGARMDDPKEIHTIETAPSDSRPVFQVRMAAVATDRDFNILPELQQVPDARNTLGRQELRINFDLDTYAIQNHNERIFLTSEKIDPRFLDILSADHEANHRDQQARAGQPRQRSAAFAGEATTLLVEDSYKRWIVSNLPAVRREFAAFSADGEDLDFEPREFMTLNRNGTVRAYMGNSLRHYFPDPKVFDAPSHDEIDFKMIAYHPLVENAYLHMLGV